MSEDAMPNSSSVSTHRKRKMTMKASQSRMYPLDAQRRCIGEQIRCTVKGCGEIFTTSEAQHRAIRHQKKCLIRFWDGPKLKDLHIERNILDHRFHCPRCDASFQAPRNFQNHTRNCVANVAASAQAQTSRVQTVLDSPPNVRGHHLSLLPDRDQPTVAAHGGANSYDSGVEEISFLFSRQASVDNDKLEIDEEASEVGISDDVSPSQEHVQADIDLGSPEVEYISLYYPASEEPEPHEQSTTLIAKLEFPIEGAQITGDGGDAPPNDDMHSGMPLRYSPRTLSPLSPLSSLSPSCPPVRELPTPKYDAKSITPVLKTEGIDSLPNARIPHTREDTLSEAKASTSESTTSSAPSAPSYAQGTVHNPRESPTDTASRVMPPPNMSNSDSGEEDKVAAVTTHDPKSTPSQAGAASISTAPSLTSIAVSSANEPQAASPALVSFFNSVREIEPLDHLIEAFEEQQYTNDARIDILCTRRGSWNEMKEVFNGKLRYVEWQIIEEALDRRMEARGLRTSSRA